MEKEKENLEMIISTLYRDFEQVLGAAFDNLPDCDDEASEMLADTEAEYSLSHAKLKKILGID